MMETQEIIAQMVTWSPVVLALMYQNYNLQVQINKTMATMLDMIKNCRPTDEASH